MFYTLKNIFHIHRETHSEYLFQLNAEQFNSRVLVSIAIKYKNVSYVRMYEFFRGNRFQTNRPFLVGFVPMRSANADH